MAEQPPNDPAWQPNTGEQQPVVPPRSSGGIPVSEIRITADDPRWGVRPKAGPAEDPTMIQPTATVTGTEQSRTSDPRPAHADVQSHRERPNWALRIVGGVATCGVAYGAYALVEHFTRR